MDGFKTFPPEPVVVTLSGTALELTPIRLGELPRLLAGNLEHDRLRGKSRKGIHGRPHSKTIMWS